MHHQRDLIDDLLDSIQGSVIDNRAFTPGLDATPVELEARLEKIIDQVLQYREYDE